MDFGRRLAHALGRWVRLACTVATLAVVVAPVALGAAVGPLMRELGADVSAHRCKCQMAPGKCGCPECVHLEKERASEQAHAHERHDPERVLRGQCEKDGPAFPFAGPPAAVLASVAAALPVPVSDRLAVGMPAESPVSSTDEPAVPPPRIASI